MPLNHEYTSFPAQCPALEVFSAEELSDKPLWLPQNLGGEEKKNTTICNGEQWVQSLRRR